LRRACSYMGRLADLSMEWEPYKAAREALLNDVLTPKGVKVSRARGAVVAAAVEAAACPPLRAVRETNARGDACA
jgi:hypothetical protein